MVTYDTTSQRNMVVWDKATASNLSHYNIYKQTSAENVYTKNGQVPYLSFSTFIDTTTNPIVMAQKYEMSAVDNLGNNRLYAPIIKQYIWK